MALKTQIQGINPCTIDYGFHDPLNNDCSITCFPQRTGKLIYIWHIS